MNRRIRSAGHGRGGPRVDVGAPRGRPVAARAQRIEAADAAAKASPSRPPAPRRADDPPDDIAPLVALGGAGSAFDRLALPMVLTLTAMRTDGGRILNVDVTLLCEAPRIGPHRERMRAAVSEMLGIGIDRVSVKATTTEGLGFTGRREGMAAQAVASIRMEIGR